jgi:hypothetical protein
MPTIELTLRDDQGRIIDHRSMKRYPLDWKSRSFHDIEGAVEDFKRSALPDIEADLLEAAQAAFIQDKKKDLICNGKTPIVIKTLHGRFEFKVQRFKDPLYPSQPEGTYFDLTDQFQERYISDRLQEFSAYYSNRLSYTEVANLISRVTGDRQLSDQKVRQIVVDKTVEISQRLREEVEGQLSNQELTFPKIEEKIDIYDRKSREILVFEDAIQVRGQKENRVHKQKITEESHQNMVKKKSPPVSTNIVMLQKKNKEFEYITAPITDQGQEIVPLPDVLKSRVLQEYGEEPEPLPIVAITDGAKVIRQH